MIEHEEDCYTFVPVLHDSYLNDDFQNKQFEATECMNFSTR